MQPGRLQPDGDDVGEEDVPDLGNVAGWGRSGNCDDVLHAGLGGACLCE
jgi:hypothetical protein